MYNRPHSSCQIQTRRHYLQESLTLLEVISIDILTNPKRYGHLREELVDG